MRNGENAVRFPWSFMKLGKDFLWWERSEYMWSYAWGSVALEWVTTENSEVVREGAVCQRRHEEIQSKTFDAQFDLKYYESHETVRVAWKHIQTLSKNELKMDLRPKCQTWKQNIVGQCVTLLLSWGSDLRVCLLLIQTISQFCGFSASLLIHALRDTWALDSWWSGSVFMLYQGVWGRTGDKCLYSIHQVD